MFLCLKLTVHYLIYRPLKYKDDGRDVVSFIDFITIHCTFPAINAWISYQMFYSAMITVTTICDTPLFNEIDSDWCSNYSKIPEDTVEHLLDRNRYFY